MLKSMRMACANAPASLSPLLRSLPRRFHSTSLLLTRCRLSSTPSLPSKFRHSFPLISPPLPSFSSLPRSIHHLCRAAEYTEYKFPDPIPEFAEAETRKFRTHMLQRLTKKNEYFGDYVEDIVNICTEILRNFLHTEYGGPGTLLVIPFIDMADTIRETGLPGAPQAARAAVVWAQNHIDEDWKEWTADGDSD